MYKRIAALVIAATFSNFVFADDAFWPNTQYSKDIPTLEQVVGHDHGERLTRPADVFKYIDALVAAAPERTQLVEYARSWNGRPLKYLVVSSADNLKNLATNQARMLKLVDPRTYSESEQAALVEQILPVSWMSYGVHGDEVSPTDASLLMAYHLLASVNDATVNEILNNSIVVIDPMLNPDGRARFIAHLETSVGLEPAVHGLAAEHRQAWPRARTNHYLFDMNRDWFALTQPETRGRVEHYQRFFPIVHVDVHEMGVNQSYYFPPPTPPFNPHLSERQKRNLELYGRGNAAAFDDFQFDYFTREIFDAHYAGYGDTWPAFHGAVAMTFEASSARGLAQLKDNGELVTYRSGVHRHFVASMATLLTSAQNGEQLLHDMANYRRSALEAEENYFFSGDASLQLKLMQTLSAQGIEVKQVESTSRACGKQRGAGTFVVQASQPAGHLVRTLLDADSPIAPEFWRDVERKRAAGEPVDVYDVLAWSMPALYGLDLEICLKDVPGLIAFDVPAEQETTWPKAAYGYLLRNDTSSSMAFLADALRHGVEVHNTGAAFTIGAKKYSRGTLLIKTAGASDDLHMKVQKLANKHRQSLEALDSSWTSAGINFGSGKVKEIKAPKIALAWDYPASSYSAGATRFVVEQELGYPVTPVRVPHLGFSDMAYFDVLILPDGGSYISELGSSNLKKLKAWVQRGGVLITLGEATRVLIHESMGLLESELEANLAAKEAPTRDGAAPGSVIDSEDEYLAEIGEGLVQPQYVPGVIVKGKSHGDHWLSAGVPETLYMLVEGQDIYTPLNQAAGTNVVRFADKSELLHGGYLWAENRSQLAYKPAVMTTEVGKGVVVGFVVNPTFRGFMNGFNVMLGNALLKGPSR